MDLSLSPEPARIAGLALAIMFGVWWMAFPASVISFYSWFHRGKIEVPTQIGVRVCGALWVLLVAVAAFMNLRQ
jgi:hypothetical protein